MGKKTCLKNVISLFILFGIAWPIHSSFAQCQKPKDYPNRPLEIIVPWGTGGGADQFSRAIAHPLEKIIGKPIKVTNKPGAATITGLTHYMSMPADGYSIFFLTNDTLIGMVAGRTSYNFDDLLYLMRGQYATEMFFAHKKDQRFKNFKDVVTYAKSHPQKPLSCAMAGAGGIDEVMISIVLKQLNIEFKLIPYTKPGERYSSLAGRHVDLLIEEPGDVRSFIEGGIFRPLIAFSDKKLEGFENLMISKDINVDLPMARWRGLALKKGTPKDVARYLECTVREAFETKSYQDYQKKVWMHLVEGWMGTKDFTSYAKKEYDIYKRVLKELGYKVRKD